MTVLRAAVTATTEVLVLASSSLRLGVLFPPNLKFQFSRPGHWHCTEGKLVKLEGGSLRDLPAAFQRHGLTVAWLQPRSRPDAGPTAAHELPVGLGLTSNLKGTFKAT